MKKSVKEVEREIDRAGTAYPPFNSAHEGFAILLEEVDELWDLVKVKQSKRDIEAMKAEAIQIAAMAVRFIEDCCEPDGRGYGQ